MAAMSNGCASTLLDPFDPLDRRGFAHHVMTTGDRRLILPVLTASITRLRKSCENTALPSLLAFARQQVE